MSQSIFKPHERGRPGWLASGRLSGPFHAVAFAVHLIYQDI
jgi:hypothetical protein